MSYDLSDDVQRTSTPVVKRQRIGEKFVGAIVCFEQRDQMTKNQAGDYVPKLKPNNKPRQELVVHCLAMPNTTASAGIGDDVNIPAPGTPVRLILKGKALGDWIEQRKLHRNGKMQVGDVVVQNITHAQAYDANGAPKGLEITDQATADALPRGTAVGFYGPITLHEPKDTEWVTAARKAYDDATAVQLPADSNPFGDEEPW